MPFRIVSQMQAETYKPTIDFKWPHSVAPSSISETNSSDEDLKDAIDQCNVTKRDPQEGRGSVYPKKICHKIQKADKSLKSNSQVHKQPVVAHEEGSADARLAS